MRPIIIITALLLGCPEAEVVDTQPLTQDDLGQPPAVSVDEPLEIEPGVVIISGSAFDAEDSPLTLLVELYSSVDELLWKGNPGTEGRWSWEGALTPGEHLLTITARDSDGHETIEQLGWHIRGENHAPTCEILYPMNGYPFDQGDSILFRGDAWDEDDDELLLLWSSDLQGSLFMGDEFELVLEQGHHTITFAVTDDRGGECTDSVSVLVGV